MSRKRLLVIEAEALIALDIASAVEEAFSYTAALAPGYAEALGFSDQFAEFALAIVTPPLTASDNRVADLLKRAGIVVIVCTGTAIDLRSTPLAGSAVVSKPFTDEILLETCRAALAADGR